MRAELALGFLIAAIPRAGDAPTTTSGPGLVVLAAAPRATAAEAVGSQIGGSAESTAARDADGSIVLVLGSDAPTDQHTFGVERARASEADDRALSAVITAASAIELRGGTWLAWYQAAHDGRHERAWPRALRAAHAGGAEVRASGGAAEWIALHAAVPRTAVGRPSQDPHDTTLDVLVEGLGLFDGAVVGTVASAAGTSGTQVDAALVSPDRVLECAFTQGLRDVLILVGEAEVTWDPDARRLTRSDRSTHVGESAEVLWVDLTAGKRSREWAYGARLGLLRPGDAFDARTRTILEGTSAVGERAPAAGLEAEIQHRLIGPKAGAVPAAAPRFGPRAEGAPRIRGVSLFHDERTLRSPRDGFSGLGIDLEFVRP